MATYFPTRASSSLARRSSIPTLAARKLTTGPSRSSSILGSSCSRNALIAPLVSKCSRSSLLGRTVGLNHRNNIVAAAAGARSFSADATASKFVFAVDEKDFQSKVMQAQVPVIVDMHAEWCGPCKTLGPKLEAAVNKLNGKVLLATVDTDKNPNLAQALQVKSLPTVMAIHNRKMIESFVGAQNEEYIAQFLNTVIEKAGAVGDANENEEVTAAGIEQVYGDALQALEAKSAPPDQIAQVFKQLCDLQIPENFSKEDIERTKLIQARSLAGLARCALQGKAVDQAKAIIETLEKDFPQYASDAQVSQAKSAVKLAGHGDQESESQDGEMESLIANRDNLSNEDRFKLATLYLSSENHEEAINEALQIVKKDPNFNEGAAKDFLLEIFTVLGPSNELAVRGRKRLTSFLLR